MDNEELQKQLELELCIYYGGMYSDRDFMVAKHAISWYHDKIMKDAVNGKITARWQKASDTHCMSAIIFINGMEDKFEEGENVKLLIIKE